MLPNYFSVSELSLNYISTKEVSLCATKGGGVWRSLKQMGNKDISKISLGLAMYLIVAERGRYHNSI